jgi:hypothetical protein
MKSSLLSVNNKTSVDHAAPNVFLRLFFAYALLAFSGWSARAAVPVLTVPASVTVAEDGFITVNIGVTDTAVPIFTVSTTATSSDTNLISNANLVFGGSGTNRLLSIRPGLHQYGTNTITIVATDSQPASTTNTFTLNVVFTNYPPVLLTNITNQIVNEDSALLNLPFTVYDIQTPASNLTYTITSSNTTLVPNSNLVVTVTGTNSNLGITLGTNQFGTSLIQLVATDTGGDSVTNDFLLTVWPVNQPPTFTVATNVLTYNEYAGVVTIPNFITGISSGPTNQSSESNWFTISYGSSFFAVPPTVDTNGNLSFEVITNVSGSNSITFTLNSSGSTTNGGVNTLTTNVTLLITGIIEPPTFTLATNFIAATEESGVVTNVGFVTSRANNGPTNAATAKWTYTLATVSTNAGEATFTTLALNTNGNLTFQPKAHSFGTNTVTVVMTIAGTYTNGWINKVTNTFEIGVAATNHAPLIVGATNRTILENSASNLTATILLWDYDAVPTNFPTNFNLVATSSNTSLVTVSVTTNAAVNGTNASYSLNFGLTTNDSGTAIIHLVASEGALSTTTNFTVTVTLINHTPTFTLSTNFVYATEEAPKTTISNFVASFSKGPTNQNAETFTYTLTTTTNATNAVFTTLALATNGVLTFQPKAHSYGTNTVTVVMTDSGGVANGGVASSTNTFNLGIDPTNHAPIVVGATNRTLLENSTSNLTQTILLWDYDSQPTNFPTNFNLVATSSNASLVTVSVTTNAAVNGTNASFTLNFGLTTNDSGTAVIHLVASEGAYTTTTNLTVTVTLINHAPSFTLSTNFIYATEEAPKTTVSNFVASFSKGPTNQNAETFTYALTTTTNTTNAVFTTLTLATNGLLTFQPKAHSYGTNTVTIVMTDSGGVANGGVASYTNTFNIGIDPTNHVPTIVGATNRTLLENSTSNLTTTILLWDYDSLATNFPANFNLVATSSNTSLVTVSVTTNAAVNGTNASFTLNFGLTTNDSGTASINLVASEGVYTTTTNFTVTVTLINHTPSFTLTTNLVQGVEESAKVIVTNFVASFSKGPTNQNAETFAYALSTVSTNGTNASFTTLTLATNGNLTYQPTVHSYGTNTVTVVMTDSGGTANGGVASTSNTFQLEIAATNHAPVIVGATNRTVLENTNAGLTATILLWDYDAQPTNFPTNFTLSAASLTNSLVTVSVTTNAAVNGTNASFTLTFGLTTNANGAATIQVVGSEGPLSTTNNFTLTITPVGKSPSFTLATNFVATTEETPTVTSSNFVTAWKNTSSKVWTFSTTTVTNAGGNASFATLPLVDTNGTLSFSPRAHSFGTNAVTVVMTDNGTNSFTNAFQIGIAKILHAPDFVATNKTVLENATNGLTATVLVWDYDAAPTNFPTNVTFTATSLSNIVSVAVSNNAVVQATNASYTLTFTLTTNANGIAPIQLVATESGFTVTNTINFTITPVTQAPSFAESTNVFVVAEETASVTNTNFLTSISTGPANQSSETYSFALTTVTNAGTNANFVQAPSITTNGTLLFAPQPHSFGTNLVTVVLTTSGTTNNGGVNTATNTFLLEVTEIDHAPFIIATTNQTVLENATNGLTATVLLWDYDPAPTNFPTNFTLTATSLSNSLVTVTVSTNIAFQVTNASYTLTYTLATNVNGVAPIQLIGTENGLSTTNIVTFTISPVNQAPSYTFATNTFLILENAGAIVSSNFLTNISVGPANQSTETYSFAVFTTTNGSPATNATFAVPPTIDTNGTLTFTTSTNSFGSNTLTVVLTTSGSLTNGGANTYTNTVQLQVTEVAYPPAFTGITNKTMLENTTTNLTLAFTLYDPLTTNFTVSCVSSNTNVVNVSVSGTGNSQTITFAPLTNQAGTNITISVTADDGTLTNTTNFSVTVVWVNQAPSFTLTYGSLTVDQYDTAVTISNAVTNILAGPTNESSQTVSFTVTNSNSALFDTAPAVDPNGTLTFTPGYKGGTVTVGIQAHDTGGNANGGTNGSPVQILTIVIPANAFQYLTGPFAGLFYPTNAADNENSGYFNLTLTSNGVFSGYVLSAGTSNIYSGQFSISNDTASVTAGPFNLGLLIDTSVNWTETVSGSVSNTNASWNAVLESYLAGYSSNFTTPLAGYYLVSLPGFADPTVGPAGYGTFDLTISNNGGVALTGFTADDTNASQVSQISLNGNYPLYLPLYNGGTAGALIGWLNFTGDLSNAVDTNSLLTWFSETNGSALYTNGFTNQVEPEVSLYTPSLTSALSFSTGTVILSGGNLAAPVTNAVTIDNNLITVNVADTNGLTLTINHTTGEVLGSFVDPTSLITNSIYSIILQNTTNEATGYFLGTNEGGSFILYGN